MWRGGEGMGQEARGWEGRGADQRARGALGIGKVALDRQLDGHREQQAREHLHGITKHT